MGFIGVEYLLGHVEEVVSLEHGVVSDAGYGGLNTPSEVKCCQTNCLAESVAIVYKDHSLVTSSRFRSAWRRT